MAPLRPKIIPKNVLIKPATSVGRLPTAVGQVADTLSPFEQGGGGALGAVIGTIAPLGGPAGAGESPPPGIQHTCVLTAQEIAALGPPVYVVSVSQACALSHFPPACVQASTQHVAFDPGAHMRLVDVVVPG